MARNNRHKHSHHSQQFQEGLAKPLYADDTLQNDNGSGFGQCQWCKETYPVTSNVDGGITIKYISNFKFTGHICSKCSQRYNILPDEEDQPHFSNAKPKPAAMLRGLAYKELALKRLGKL
jgi:hypothetical protein